MSAEDDDPFKKKWDLYTGAVGAKVKATYEYTEGYSTKIETGGSIKIGAGAYNVGADLNLIRIKLGLNGIDIKWDKSIKTIDIIDQYKIYKYGHGKQEEIKGPYVKKLLGSATYTYSNDAKYNYKDEVTYTFNEKATYTYSGRTEYIFEEDAYFDYKNGKVSAYNVGKQDIINGPYIIGTKEFAVSSGTGELKVSPAMTSIKNGPNGVQITPVACQLVGNVQLGGVALPSDLAARLAAAEAQVAAAQAKAEAAQAQAQAAEAAAAAAQEAAEAATAKAEALLPRGL
jgi:hypothetical protein